MTPFAIRYRTATPLSPRESQRVQDSLARFAGGSAWTLCEAPTLHADSRGHLAGQSLVKLAPAPEEVRAAMAVCGPDGTAETLLEVLDQVSRECSVDWELSHSQSEVVVGGIHHGVADSGVQRLLDRVSELSESQMPDDASEPPVTV